jgi:hypothetical protein
MKTPLAAAGLVLSLSVQTAIAAPPAVIPSERRACEAALATVELFTAHKINGVPWIVADNLASQEGPAFSANEQVLIKQRWGGEAPSKELARTFIASKPMSVLNKCAVVAAYLDQTGIKYGAAAAHEATVDKKTGRPLRIYSASILRLSLPIVARDGDDALIEVTTAGGWLMGGVNILHLHRTSTGNWVDVGQLTTAIG